MPDIPPPTPADLVRSLIDDLAFCDVATPAPWESRSECIESPAGVRPWVGCGPRHFPRNEPNAHDAAGNDADFICAAREGWPAAIRRAIAAEAEVARLRRLLSFRGEALGIAEARAAELERTIAVQQAMIDERERIIKSLCPG